MTDNDANTYLEVNMNINIWIPDVDILNLTFQNFSLPALYKRDWKDHVTPSWH